MDHNIFLNHHSLPAPNRETAYKMLASTQKRVPDLVFLMRDDSLFHMELHSKSEDMDWRMLM